MKDFEIKENSWHFKFNEKFLLKTAKELIRCDTDAKKYIHTHTNFCQYWRMTLKHLIGSLFLGAIILGLVALVLTLFGLMFHSLFTDPITTLQTVGAVILMFVVVVSLAIGIVTYGEHLGRAKKARAAGEIPEGFLDELTSKSIVLTKFKTLKEKICPQIKFVSKKE